MVKRSWAYKHSAQKVYSDAQRAAYWKKKYFGCQELYLTLKKSYTYRKGK